MATITSIQLCNCTVHLLILSRLPIYSVHQLIIDRLNTSVEALKSSEVAQLGCTDFSYILEQFCSSYDKQDTTAAQPANTKAARSQTTKPARPQTTNAKAGASKKRKALHGGDETRALKKPRPMTSVPAATTANDDASRISTTNGFKCRCINSGVMSTVFVMEGFDGYTGPPSNIDKNTLVLDLASGEWKPCPVGFRPRVDEGTSAVLRHFIGLADD
ncbi:hypothetical protein DFH09DRAFT_1098088 [Mycena vulgaris]|nr:hypothetical protein DFH09DRAFT_1098088 [Mycena vulgaris]